MMHASAQGLPDGGEFLLVDKPLDWTSFDVVARIRSAYKKGGIRKYKVGHTGTLDPKATGLLIIATGRKTREIPSLEGLDKEYEATFRLGAQTESHDTETEEFGHTATSHLTEEEILRAASAFLGRRMQQAPMHSATWHQGKRLYELARKGEVVSERKIKEIEVHRFDILGIALPYLTCRLRVSKGAYIRVIAHEFGEALGVGAYLSALKRTAIGPYRLQDAIGIEEARERIFGQLATGEGA